MSTPPGKGRIKGAAFKGFVAHLEAERGLAAVAALAEALPAEVRKHFLPGRPALGLLAASWYPAEVVHAFLDAATAGLPEGEQDALAGRAALTIMEANLKGVYRTFFSFFVSPRTYALAFPQIWGMHYDSGVVRFTEPVPHAHRAEFTDWRGHHAFACKLNFAAAGPLYAAMKCREVVARHEACVSRGTSACVFDIRWQAA